jgi:hypothetical protein
VLFYIQFLVTSYLILQHWKEGGEVKAARQLTQFLVKRRQQNESHIRWQEKEPGKMVMSIKALLDWSYGSVVEVSVSDTTKFQRYETELADSCNCTREVSDSFLKLC